MPDIIFIITKRWKLILGSTAAATLLALVVSLLLPKQYLATVTALPANSALADKARLFNSNIESLYPELGSPDELDRIEGTVKLDTIYLAVADSFKLAEHYKMAKTSLEEVDKIATRLKKNTDIRRSPFGELKIKVWDKSPQMAAQLANALFNKLNEIHRNVINANNTQILERLREGLLVKQQELDSILQERLSVRSDDLTSDTIGEPLENIRTYLRQKSYASSDAYAIALQEEIKQRYSIISQYQLAVSINPQVLIAVENARPGILPDKPKMFRNVLFAFGASLIFSFLLILFLETRKAKL